MKHFHEKTKECARFHTQRREREEKDVVQPPQSLASEVFPDFCFYCSLDTNGRLVCAFIISILQSHGLMACCLHSERFSSEPFCCRFTLTLAEVESRHISCMGGHAATTLFIICTAGEIAFFYHYVLSMFLRIMKYSVNT